MSKSRDAVEDIRTIDTVTATANAALPKAGGALTGTVTNFTSTGIDDNATSTAVTIDASEKVTLSSTDSENLFIDGGHSTNASIKIKSAYHSNLYAKLTESAGQFIISADDGNQETNSCLRFKVKGTERMRLTPDGLTFNGDTAAANALDDYEEGTFVATLRGVTSDPSTAVTTTSMYRKIGETVYITIAFENWSTTGASGDIEVTGLPFTSSPTGRFFITAAFYNGATWDDDKTPVSNVQANSTKILCHAIDSNGTWNTLTHNAGSSGRYFWFSGTYPTGS